MIDPGRPVMMFGLVASRADIPRSARTCSGRDARMVTNFARPHRAGELQPDHGLEGRSQMLDRPLYDRFRHRPDRFRVSRLDPPGREPRDGHEPVEDARRDKLLGHPPLERLLDQPGPTIALAAGKPLAMNSARHAFRARGAKSFARVEP